MITAIHKSMAAKRDRLTEDKGFTLIELLVVILIIGILAAIAIPVFLGQQAQAQDAAAKANLANAKIAYSSYLVNNPGGTDNPNELNDFGWPKGTDTYIKSGGTDYCLISKGAGDRDWHIRARDNAPSEGGC